MPERIEAAMDRVVDAFHELRATMQQRTEHFTRILIGLGVLSLVQLLSLLLIISAVTPGMPVLRVYERNAKRTAEFIVKLDARHIEILDRLPTTTTTTTSTVP